MTEKAPLRLDMPGYDPRDFVGYGRNPPNPQWPGGARIAVQIALNYEAGGEHNILYGDAHSEGVLIDSPLGPVHGKRNAYSESTFEYGARVGTWRLLRIMRERGVKCSFLAVVKAIELNPDIAVAAVEDGHEMVGHGYRWIDYADVPEDVERDYIARSIASIETITGQRPVGWMSGRPSMNTRKLLAEAGLLYDRDSLGDELPYWVDVNGKPHLCVPYSYETNDLRCSYPADFVTSEDYFTYMKDAFDMLYEEGATHPTILCLALHDRLLGRPARAVGFARLLDYMLKHDKVWIARGDEIARHWVAHFPPPAKAARG
jgi:peptidoglycan/xylan/chitin deacetylase (PgdA/CDA1 family)